MRLASRLALAGLVLGAVASAAPAQASAAAPRSYTGYIAVGTVSPWGHAPGSGKPLCLAAVPAVNQPAYWERCVPGDAYQQWSAVRSQYGGGLALSPLSNPFLCVGGVPYAYDYASLSGCPDGHPSAREAVYVTGGTAAGAQNSVRASLSGRWLTSRNGFGYATWQAAKSLFQRIFRRFAAPNQVVRFNGELSGGGWEQVTVD